MTGSASAEAGRERPVRLSARVWLPALALIAYSGGGVAPAGAQESQVTLPDSAVHTLTETVPGRYGPVTDSLVLALCEGLPIRRVDIRCLDIFDPVPVGRMHGFYGLANGLHVRTRESTVRSRILLVAGGVWNAERVLETDRQLRQLEYINPDPVLSRVNGDSVDVLVVTHDQWTTQPELNVELGGGKAYGSVGINEQNLLGLGVGLEFSLREDPTGKTRTGSISGQRLFGTQLEGQFQAGTGRGGVSNAVSLRDPFRSLDDRLSWTTSLWRADFQHQLFEDGSLAAEFPFRFHMTQLEWAMGGQTRKGVVRRYALGFVRHDRFYGPTENEPGFEGSFPGGNEELKLRWVAARALFWRPGFIVRRSVQLFDPAEDFDLGELVSLEGGVAPRAFGSTANEGIVRAQLEAGRETRRFGFGFARGRFSTRLRGSPRETLTSLDARWIQQPTHNVAIVMAAFGQAAAEAQREVQYVVGGLNGLRAYGVQELAGTQVWRFNAETRWVVARRFLDFASVGGAAFVDAARAWGPGGDREPWHHDVGFGLRLAFPQVSLHKLARIDVAFPLSPSRDGRREPVFSFGSSQAF